MKVEILLKFLNEMIKKFQQEYSKFTQLSECRFSQNVGLEIKFLGKSHSPGNQFLN